jgi:hypothetical protein
VVETPGSDIENQIDKLSTALDDAFTRTRDLEYATDHVLATLLPDAEGHDDDVTLLLARLPAAPLNASRVELLATASAVSAGRSFAVDTLTAWHCAHKVDDVRLLVSEPSPTPFRGPRRPYRRRRPRRARSSEHIAIAVAALGAILGRAGRPRRRPDCSPRSTSWAPIC